jgi:formylglycine-generating enzyme required for sulfatase activity
MSRYTVLRRGIQSVLVVCGVIALTSFSIDATDTLRSSQTALGIMASQVTTSNCPEDMTPVTQAETSFCIDRYESGVGDGCIVTEPRSPSETALNAVDADCGPVSQAAVMPWRFVTMPQAAQLCARVGKRLPTADEWYDAALGTADSERCNEQGELATTGAYPECQSGSEAFDMIGNVWEFVQGDVVAGVTARRSLPPSGYVSEVDVDGLATKSTSTPQTIFNDDYLWSSATGTYALMRGGYYGSGSDGGLYSVHASIDRNFSSNAIGFRCAKSL